MSAWCHCPSGFGCILTIRPPLAAACRSIQYGQCPPHICLHPVTLHVHFQMLRVLQVPQAGPRMCDHLAALSQQSLSHNRVWYIVSRHHVCPCLHILAVPHMSALCPCRCGEWLCLDSPVFPSSSHDAPLKLVSKVPRYFVPSMCSSQSTPIVEVVFLPCTSPKFDSVLGSTHLYLGAWVQHSTPACLSPGLSSAILLV